MPTYEQLQHLSPEQFRRACGVKLQTFNRLVEVLAEAKAKQKPGRPSVLSLKNQLLLTLEYLREYRTSSPSYGVVDSQSVDTATMIHQDVGVDGNKRIKGRKRHVMVDSLGIPLAVVVTAAHISDIKGLRFLLE